VDYREHRTNPPESVGKFLHPAEAGSYRKPRFTGSSQGRTFWALNDRCYIRQMRSNFRVAMVRLGFLLCGAASLRISSACRLLTQFFPGAPGEWLALSAFLLATGLVSLLTAVLPGNWAMRLRRGYGGNATQSGLPIKALLSFAACSYLVTTGLGLWGAALSPPPAAVYTVCPACVLTVTVDPSPLSVLLVLSPMNAAVYGSIGGTIGWLSVLLRRAFS
jgi:hypothetical protein